jgi:PhnB protein
VKVIDQARHSCWRCIPVDIGFHNASPSSATIKNVHLNPYLSFNGQCEKAFRFYENCLGAKIVMMMTCGAAPMAEQTPPGWRDKILHASLALGDQILQGADTPPEHYQKPRGFSLSLNIDSPEEANRVFNALAEGGAVQMQLQETFWALRFGMLIDQFGTPWMINCGKPA